MDRCDFSSIMTYLKNHISKSNQMRQPEFLYEVFEDFMDSPDATVSEVKKNKLALTVQTCGFTAPVSGKADSFGMERQFVKRDTRNQKLFTAIPFR